MNATSSLDDYLRDRYAPATARLYAYEIGRYLDRCGGEAVARRAGYADLVRHLAELRRRHPRPGTLKRILSAIKAYYRYLVATEQRADLPGEGLRLRDVDRPGIQHQDLLTDAELAALLAERPERYAGLRHRNRTIVGLLVHQALTQGELSRLRVPDVDLAAATLRVPATRQTLARTLPLTAGQILPLQTYLATERPALLRQPTDHLLLTQRGTAERGEGIRHLVQTLRPRVADKRLTPTVIRESVIAQRLRKGEDLRHVQAFAGHKYVSTTEGYRESQLAELRRGVARYHPLDAGEPKS